MLEQRRVDYLKAMGITLWMPRQALPHAKESRWLPENNDERHQHIAINSTGVSSRPAAAADLLRAGQPMHKHEDSVPEVKAAHSVLSETASSVSASQSEDVETGTPQNPAAQNSEPQNSGTQNSGTQNSGTQNSGTLVAESPSVSPAAVHDMRPPRFVLEFIPISRQGLWVIDASQSIQDVQQFAYRVLKGMGAAPDFMSQPINFSWPFIESSHQDQSRPVALQALQAQWQFFQSQGTRYIITLGAEAQQWMASVEANSHFHVADMSMLQSDAQLKRQLWLCLRQLPEL
jgi:hypothetical protein